MIRLPSPCVAVPARARASPMSFGIESAGRSGKSIQRMLPPPDLPRNLLRSSSVFMHWKSP